MSHSQVYNKEVDKVGEAETGRQAGGKWLLKARNKPSKSFKEGRGKQDSAAIAGKGGKQTSKDDLAWTGRTQRRTQRGASD